MKSRKDELEQRGIKIVVVSFAAPSQLVIYQQYYNWPFLVLADPSRKAYEAFALPRLSLLRIFSFATLRLYVKLLWEGWRQQYYGKDDYYQAGGDFIVDAEGAILFAHRSRNPADRPSVAKLLRAYDNIRGLVSPNEDEQRP